MKTLSELMPITRWDERRVWYIKEWSTFKKDTDYNYRLIEFDTWTNIKWYINSELQIYLCIWSKDIDWWISSFSDAASLLSSSDPNIKVAVEAILKKCLSDFNIYVWAKVEEMTTSVLKDLETVLNRAESVMKSTSKVISQEEMQAKFISRIMDMITKKTKDILIWEKSVFSFFKKW